MNLAIDCRMSGKSGIGTFLDSMLPTFIEEVCGDNSEQSPTVGKPQTHRGHILLIGLPQKKWEEFQAAKIAGIENCELLPCPIKNFSIKEMLFFPRAALKKINSCDAYFSPYCNIPGNIFTLTRKKIPVYCTIHDVIFLDMPDMAGRLGTFLREIIYKRAIRKSKEIFTVSNFSKSRIQENLNCTKNITVVYSGVPILYETSSVQNPTFAATQQNIAKHSENKTNTIIFVGNIKKHKGLGILILAFIKFRKSLEQTENVGKTPTDSGVVEQSATSSNTTTSRGAPLPQLLIVGSKENFRTQDTTLENLISSAEQNGIVFTGFVPDQELKTLISQARLLVQPSLYEGFGVPPLQALYSGTKAIISDILVFKEIYEKLPVTFFRTGDVGDLAQKMRELYFDDAPLPKFERIYSYKKSAQIILNAIRAYLEKQRAMR